MPKTEGAKAPLNPLYVGVPFIAKRTGEVRRCKQAKRFSRALVTDAIKTQAACAHVGSLTVTDDNTTYILSQEQTRLVIGTPDTIEAMVINGWIVEPTSPANMSFVRFEQKELL